MAIRLPLTIRVKRKGAASAFEAVVRACATASIQSSQATVQVETNLHSDSVALGFTTAEGGKPVDLAEPLSLIRNRLESDPFERLVQVGVHWPNISNSGQPGAAILKSMESDFNDSIELNSSQGHNQQHREAFGRLLAVIRKNFEPIDPVVERFKALPTELKTYHEEQQRLFQEQREELLRGHRELGAAIQQANAAAEKRIAQAREEFTTRDGERETRYSERVATLERREEALRAEKANLDDRQRTHARRSHEKAVAAVLDQHRDFQLSKPAQRKRWPIHVACVVALILAVGLYALALKMGAERPNPFLLVPASVVFASTLAFYLMWLKAWFDTHAQAESATRAFQEDFSRAHWLVELMFEWGELKEKKDFPPEVLAALSKGLFSVRRQYSEGPGHPLFDVMSQVKSIKKLSYGKQPFSLETRDESKGDSPSLPS